MSLNTRKVLVRRSEGTQKKSDDYEWQEKRIKERLKKANKDGKFLSGDQVDEIVDSFKP